MDDKVRPARVLVRRHTVVTRLTHWLNVLAVSLLLMSGLQIFNAHPALYWGAKSTFADPWLSMSKVEVGDTPRGITKVGDLTFDTTGVLGWSGKEGMREQRCRLEAEGVRFDGEGRLDLRSIVWEPPEERLPSSV